MKTLFTFILPLVLLFGFGSEVQEAIAGMTSSESSTKPGPLELGNGQTVPDALGGQAFRYA